MIFKVNQYQKVPVVLYKYPSADGPVIVDTGRVVFGVSIFSIYPDGLEPIYFLFVELLDLGVGSIEIPEHLHRLPLHLQLRLLRHQRSKRRSPEVSGHLHLEVGDVPQTAVEFPYLVPYDVCAQLGVFV